MEVLRASISNSNIHLIAYFNLGKMTLRETFTFGMSKNINFFVYAPCAYLGYKVVGREGALDPL